MAPLLTTPDLPELNPPRVAELGRWSITYSLLGARTLDRCLVYHHGVPGSRREARFLHEAGQRHNVSVLAIDRPGVGGSLSDPSFTPSQWPALLEALLNSLKVKKAALLGVSGGSPYALQAAAHLSTRVTKLLIVSGVAPFSIPQAMAGVHFTNRVALRSIQKVPQLAGLLAPIVRRFFLSSPKNFVRATAVPLGADDKQKFSDEGVIELFAMNFHEHLSQTSHTLSRELKCLTSSWEVPHLPNIPTWIWHGDDDRVVSRNMGVYLHQKIPNSTFTLMEGKGHLAVAELPDTLLSLL